MMTAVATIMNPDVGNVTRKISIAARIKRSFRVGLNVFSLENGKLDCRRGRSIGGEPSHDVLGLDAPSSCVGESESTPKRDSSPSMVPSGITALFPTKVRRPRLVCVTVIHPPSTFATPSDTSSAIVDSSPIFSRSGADEVTVENSTNLPIFAPSARYQGAR